MIKALPESSLGEKCVHSGASDINQDTFPHTIYIDFPTEVIHVLYISKKRTTSLHIKDNTACTSFINWEIMQ